MSDVTNLLQCHFGCFLIWKYLNFQIEYLFCYNLDLDEDVSLNFDSLFDFYVWLWILNTLRKVRWKLHKNTVCYFEQILEAAPYKTSAVQPLTSHLTNDSSKTRKAYWPLLRKQEQTHKLHSLMDSYTRTYQYWPTRKKFTFISLVKVLGTI